MKNSINIPVKKYYRDCGKNWKTFDWQSLWWRFRALPSYYYQQKRIRDTKKSINALDLKGRVLDAACGPGNLLISLPAGSVGIEINPRHVKTARLKAPHTKVIVGDIEEIPYADNYFDSILICEVFEHIPDAEPIISELWRVLKKGGLLIITVPHRHFLWNLRYLASPMSQTEPQCLTYDKHNIKDLLKDRKYKKIKLKKIAWGLNLLLIVRKNDSRL